MNNRHTGHCRAVINDPEDQGHGRTQLKKLSLAATILYLQEGQLGLSRELIAGRGELDRNLANLKIKLLTATILFVQEGME